MREEGGETSEGRQEIGDEGQEKDKNPQTTDSQFSKNLRDSKDLTDSLDSPNSQDSIDSISPASSINVSSCDLNTNCRDMAGLA